MAACPRLFEEIRQQSDLYRFLLPSEEIAGGTRGRSCEIGCNDAQDQQQKA